jgi:hypothetical protein
VLLIVLYHNPQHTDRENSSRDNSDVDLDSDSDIVRSFTSINVPLTICLQEGEGSRYISSSSPQPLSTSSDVPSSHFSHPHWQQPSFAASQAQQFPARQRIPDDYFYDVEMGRWVPPSPGSSQVSLYECGSVVSLTDDREMSLASGQSSRPQSALSQHTDICHEPRPGSAMSHPILPSRSHTPMSITSEEQIQRDVSNVDFPPMPPTSSSERDNDINIDVDADHDIDYDYSGHFKDQTPDGSVSESGGSTKTLLDEASSAYTSIFSSFVLTPDLALQISSYSNRRGADHHLQPHQPLSSQSQCKYSIFVITKYELFQC